MLYTVVKFMLISFFRHFDDFTYKQIWHIVIYLSAVVCHLCVGIYEMSAVYNLENCI